jgi:hypothetical protein
MLGRQDRCGVCAGIDFVTEDGCDEVGPLERRWLADGERRPGLPLSQDVRPVYPASKAALNAMSLA